MSRSSEYELENVVVMGEVLGGIVGEESKPYMADRVLSSVHEMNGFKLVVASDERWVRVDRVPRRVCRKARLGRDGDEVMLRVVLV